MTVARGQGAEAPIVNSLPDTGKAPRWYFRDEITKSATRPVWKTFRGDMPAAMRGCAGRPAKRAKLGGTAALFYRGDDAAAEKKWLIVARSG